MSHIPYTICRSGTYYYNRRVPKHAVKAYGSFIRQSLSQCPEEAAEYAKRLGYVLEASWKSRAGVTAIDVPTVIESFTHRYRQKLATIGDSNPMRLRSSAPHKPLCYIVHSLSRLFNNKKKNLNRYKFYRNYCQ